jgi:hypothetical protein
MKIRTATMLLAGSFILLTAPTLNGQEAVSLTVSHYTRSQTTRIGCIQQEFQAPSNYVYTLHWDTSHEWWSHQASGSGTTWETAWGSDCNPAVERGAEYFAHWLPNAATTQRQCTSWYGGVYTNWLVNLGAWSYYTGGVPWRHCSYNTTTPMTNEASGIVYANTDSFTEATKIELRTGGDEAGVTNEEVIIQLSVSAMDDNTSTPIPVSELTALGKTPTPDGTNIYSGHVLKKSSDYQKMDATVTANRSCYSYAATAGKGKLMLRRNGVDVTGKTNSIYVGELVDIEGLLAGLGTSTPAISNYQWTVPGQMVGGWVIDGTGTNNHMGKTVPVTNYTGAVMRYYWTKDEKQGVTVTCTVQVQGIGQLTASTVFRVGRPEARWTLTPKFGKVAILTNSCSLPPQMAGYLALGTGFNCTTNDVGMYYDCEFTNFDGYVGLYDFFMIQIATVNWKFNSVTPNLSWYIDFRGIDTRYPSGWRFRDATKGYATDTPVSFLLDEIKFEWRRDDFETYLMWQPTRAPSSIPVPLKRADWNWYGRARRMSTNNPGLFHLVTPSIWPQAATGTDVYTHPTWTNNVWDFTPTFNTFWYTEP